MMSWGTRVFSPLPFMGEGAGERVKPRAPSPKLSHKWERGIVCAGLFILLALTTYAAADNPSLAEQITACALQAEERPSLACYDALAANLNLVEKPASSAKGEPINEENALFKLSCAYFAKDC